MASLLKSFAFVANMISCLGISGLTAFNAERRIKEIGTIKVLGAGIGNIIFLMSSDFLKMILIALVIGLPSFYFIAQEQISSFAFAINITPVQFFLAGMILLIIGCIDSVGKPFWINSFQPICLNIYYCFFKRVQHTLIESFLLNLLLFTLASLSYFNIKEHNMGC